MNNRTGKRNWHNMAGVAALLLLGTGGAQAKTITVTADGSGDFKTMQEAIAAVPDNSAERTTIHIKPGTYQGQMILPKEKSNVSFEGEDVEGTVLTFNLNTNEENPPSVNQRYKGTGVVILGDDFHADKITFQNASGDHGQALALRIDGDRAVVTNCRLLGWQDTLMVNNGRQYFKDSYIEGRVDFIYGSGTAVFDKCEIKSKNGGHVTAASTPQEKPYGLVFLDCRLTGDPTPWTDPATGKWPTGRRLDARADLGRPWRPYGNVAFINCQMGDHILPVGWNNWGKVENEKTARYAEYNSRMLDAKLPDGTIVTGKPVDVSKRVPWSKQLTKDEAAQYTMANIFGDWNPLASSATTTAMAPTAPTVVIANSVQSALLSAQRPEGIKVRIALAGDSTVTDDAGWGAGFKALLQPGAECINMAKGGRSSGSFVAEGRWKQTLELKPDYVLIQFGHNDEPGHGPERETDPKTTYRANMARYVDEAKAAGIQPVLVTSLSRRQFGPDGKIHSTLTPYVETVQQIAAEKKVPLLDLHARSIALYEKLGPEGVKEISPAKEGGGYDGTHLNAQGSAMIAPLVVDELKKAVPDLAPYLK